MWRTKSMRSRPYALTEWFESSTSQIQGTRAAVALGVSLSVAEKARARKASTFSAAGASPSRKSLRSGRSGVRRGGSRFGIRRREGRECGLVEDFITHHRITP